MIGKIHFATMSKSVCLATMLLAGAVFATTAKSATGPYFGQTPPGTAPQIFAPGILSLANRMEGGIAFSTDGNECCFTVSGSNGSSQIYYTKCVNNVWTDQVDAELSVGHSVALPSFSLDGNKLYFDRVGAEPNHIWVVQRTEQGWSDAQLLSSPINYNYTGYTDFSYSETADGTAYITSDRPGGRGGMDIWRIRQMPGQMLQAENLGAIVNSDAHDYEPCVDPYGQYLIFASQRSGGHGATDLYVSYNNGNGGWTTPFNMDSLGAGYNTSGDEYAPSLSPDGRYLFFARYNGVQGDIYWVANPFYVPEPATAIQLALAAMLLGLAGIRRFHGAAISRHNKL